MAYNLTYWADDNGKGQYQLHSTRLKSVEEIFPLTLPHNRPNKTVLIILERSDNHKYDRIVWQKNGYDDPCAIKVK